MEPGNEAGYHTVSTSQVTSTSLVPRPYLQSQIWSLGMRLAIMQSVPPRSPALNHGSRREGRHSCQSGSGQLGGGALEGGGADVISHVVIT